MSDQAGAREVSNDHLAAAAVVVVLIGLSMGAIVAKVDEVAGWLRDHRVLLPSGAGVIDVGRFGALDVPRIVIVAMVVVVVAMITSAIVRGFRRVVARQQPERGGLSRRRG